LQGPSSGFRSSNSIVTSGDIVRDSNGVEYVLIREGNTETIDVTITLSDIGADGTYRVVLTDILFTDNISGTPLFKTVSVNYRTEYQFIESLLASTGKADSSATLSSNANAFLTTDFELGMSHPGVINLQKFLNSNGYIIETASGKPGSAGYESDYFGEKTKQALIRFQKDKGISPAQGYFGPKTRAVMGI
jgi:hypothetical protein